MTKAEVRERCLTIAREVAFRQFTQDVTTIQRRFRDSVGNKRLWAEIVRREVQGLTVH